MIKCKIFGHKWKFIGMRHSQATGNSIFVDKCIICGALEEEVVN
jgi:hypothetical protein